MTALKILVEALKFYEIEKLLVEDNHLILQHNYQIEVDANGIYKLKDDGYVVGPFDDINELCRFVRS